MTYEEILKKNIDEYTNLKSKYDDMIHSEKYRQITATMPFDFLKGRYILDTLSLYKDLNGTARINFVSGEEAIQRFYDIVNFKQNIPEILDNAAFISEIAELENEINKLVEDNTYLSSSMQVSSMGKLENIAKDCLKEIPKYSTLKTKQFRIGYIESCIETLDQNELNKLLVAKIIKGADLDKIKLTGSPSYENNIKYLCEITGHIAIIEKQLIKRLKGVKYEDKNGISRQDYLKQISQIIKETGTPPQVTAQAYMYKPEMGIEEPAIQILWEDKCLGFMPRDVAQAIHDNYINPYFDVKIKEVLGGNDISYGLEIEFNIISSKYNEKEIMEELEK